LGPAVVNMSQVPARILGRAATSGRIAAGMAVDMVALDPDLRVAWTMVGGQLPNPRPGSVRSP